MAGDCPRTRPEEAWDEDRAKRLLEELGLRTPRRVVCETHHEGPAVDDAEPPAAIVAFGDRIATRDDLAEVDFIPLRVTAHGLLVLDALVVAR